MSKVNGQAPEGAQIQVTPSDAARYALQFMQRAHMVASERQAFALAESFLQAIASGQVVLTQPATTIGAELPPEVVAAQ